MGEAVHKGTGTPSGCFLPFQGQVAKACAQSNDILTG